MPKGSRSRTPVQKEGKAVAKPRKATPTGKSRSKTPTAKKSNAKPQRSASNTPVKAPKSATKSDNQRKFYTVKEDNTIFSAWKAAVAAKTTVSEVAKKLAGEMNRSEESVRDRIKRYLSKLNANDQKRLATAAKSTPNHHISFVADKQGGQFKAIGSINEGEPGPNFKSANKVFFFLLKNFRVPHLLSPLQRAPPQNKLRPKSHLRSQPPPRLVWPREPLSLGLLAITLPQIRNLSHVSFF